MTKPKEKDGAHSRRRVNLILRFTQVELPPVNGALVIGKRAHVGAHGTARAFQEMAPGMFRLIELDHPLIEGILVRECHLRKLPEKELVSRLVRQAEKMMSETDVLHVTIELEVTIEEEGIEV